MSNVKCQMSKLREGPALDHRVAPNRSIHIKIEHQTPELAVAQHQQFVVVVVVVVVVVPESIDIITIIILNQSPNSLALVLGITAACP